MMARITTIAKAPTLHWLAATPGNMREWITAYATSWRPARRNTARACAGASAASCAWTGSDKGLRAFAGAAAAREGRS